jgi:hypothetical protein
MLLSVRIQSAVAGALVAILLTSCHRGPAAVHQPSIDPDDAGSQAMEMYDTNRDGQVAGDELAKAPGINAAVARLDTNGDKGVSADEVAERVRVWQKMGHGLTSFSFKVTLDGSPLAEASVVFEPEEFLGNEIQAAECKTDMFGGGGATIPKEKRPDPERTPPGMQLGLYTVKISKVIDGKETIPANYNQNSVLGQEVAPDVSAVATNQVVYALTTK